METPNSAKTEAFGPTIRTIIILIVGMVLFGKLSYVVLTIPKQVNSLASAIIIYGQELLFVLFFVFSLYYIFQIKTIILLHDEMTIRYLSRFKRVTVPFKQIIKATVLPQVINASTGYGITTIYNGKKVLLEFDNKKKLEIDSFQTRNFEGFLELLMKQKRKFSS